MSLPNVKVHEHIDHSIYATESDVEHTDNHNDRTACLPFASSDWYASYCKDGLLSPNHDKTKAYQVLALDPLLDADTFEKAVQDIEASLLIADELCPACLHLMSNWPNLMDDTEEDDWFLHRRPVSWSCDCAYLEAASRLGCKCCSTIHTALRRMDRFNLLRRLEKRLVALEQDHRSSIHIDAWVHRSTRGSFHNERREEVLLSPPGTTKMDSLYLWNLELRADRVGLHNGVSAKQDWAETTAEWLQTDDERCDQLGLAFTNMPTRLICLKGGNIRLMTTGMVSDCSRYATLSYSWGTKRFLTLTSQNLAEWKSSIPFEDLPLVFKEAIAFVRELGIDYLWIDALCIVQDDQSDWLKESALMQAVYGGSYLNIAAATSTSAHHSMYTMPSTHRTAFSARVTTPTYSCIRNFWLGYACRMALSYNHLATRAWTYQEKLLARRTVYVGDQGLWWQCCNQEVASNFLRRGHPDIYRQSAPWKRDGAFKWQRIQREYSQACLSRSTDKLAALAGIARRQHEIEGDKYIAGMWEKHLPEQLCWRVRETATRPVEIWRAPTWSWMSIDGDIFAVEDYLERRWSYRRFVRVLQVQTVPMGPDEFGGLEAAHLRMACSVLVRARIHALDVMHLENDATLGGTSLNALLVLDGHELHVADVAPLVGNGLTGSNPPSCKHVLLGVVLDAAQDDGLEMDDPVYIVPVYELRTNDLARNPGGHKLHALVLKADTEEKGTFRRVGIYYSNEPVIIERLLQYLIEWSVETTRDMSREVRVDDGGTDFKFNIKLI